MRKRRWMLGMGAAWARTRLRRNRIVTPVAPWVAFEEAAGGEESAAEGAMEAEGLGGVFRAGRGEATAAAWGEHVNDRGNGVAVDEEGGQENRGEDAVEERFHDGAEWRNAWRAPKKRRRKSLHDAVRMRDRAMRRRSQEGGR